MSDTKRRKSEKRKLTQPQRKSLRKLPSTEPNNSELLVSAKTNEENTRDIEDAKTKEIENSIQAFQFYLDNEIDVDPPIEEEIKIEKVEMNAPTFYNSAVLNRGLELADYRGVLSSNTYLSDNVILAMTNLMGRLNQGWTGLADTAQKIQPAPATSANHLQIIHVPSNHWVLTLKAKNNLFLLNSLGKKYNNQTTFYKMREIYGNSLAKITCLNIDIQRKPTCGDRCLAYQFLLLAEIFQLVEHLELLEFDDNSLRDWVARSIVNKHVTMPPFKSKNVVQISSIISKLF